MRASHHAHAPQPLPLPLPPPPLSLPSPSDTPRRRHPRRTASSSSSSSSSSSVSTASFFCPSPSPAASPRASTSLVPFSWERHPGVPKDALPGAADDPAAGAPLPLPPPLRQPPRRRRRRRRANAGAPAGASGADTGGDPFVAAIAECTRDDDDVGDGADADADAEFTVAHQKLWLAPAKPAAATGRAERRWRLAGGGFVGFLDLYGCKNAMAVADGAFLTRRPVAAARAGAARAARR
ncbi:hypothetical protein ACP4OV_003748 [Aristida adscensionis]